MSRARPHDYAKLYAACLPKEFVFENVATELADEELSHVLALGANERDDWLPEIFVGDWCFAEHTADHLAFYRRGSCANPDNVEDWLTISPDGFDVHEMHLLVARANKRGDYLAKFRCDDNLMQNYWFSLFNDRLYVSQTNTEPRS